MTASTHTALPVVTEMRGPVLWITINREERRNALNEEVVLLIDRAIEAPFSFLNGGKDPSP